MRKAQKQMALEFVQTLQDAHEEIKKLIESKEHEQAMEVLAQCQQGAIELGNFIEETAGEGTQAVVLLEKYCERVFHFYEELNQKNLDNVAANLRVCCNRIQEAEDRIKNDIKVRREVVFFPYKASMWDSLESVYLAAKEDPDCDAYCVPIPYYDKNPDGSFAAMHYEGRAFPAGIEVIDWQSYKVEERKPDAVFIHNPYDDCNHVTSVHPDYYSSVLKKHTDMLVYIPYYATAGGMSEAQAMCPAYNHADYIIVQAEKYEKFFDPVIPRSKLLALGSPKFDNVIRICNNPPEAPAAWKEKMAGKKVCFYNTSIHGMLTDTRRFLLKMEYVFNSFVGRKDVCMIWRPHPLLESTFASMRPAYKPIYDAIKKKYLESDFGIYDDTPDITNTIALCDAYIGDAGTSVTSLFGIAGKPLFILNNNIDTLPEEDDWRGEIIRRFFIYGNNEWMVTQGNKLYRSGDKNYDYKYFCDLSDYAYGDYYGQVMHVNGKDYVCPINAQDILVIGEKGIAQKIDLEYCIETRGAFYAAISCGKYIFLIPNNYPAIVRYDTEMDKVDYLRDNLDIFMGTIGGQKRLGGFCVWKNYLFLASPVDSRVLVIQTETGKMKVLITGAENRCGCAGIMTDDKDLWLLPCEGKVITRWNPESGEVREYNKLPENFRCEHPVLGYEFEERPFGFGAINEDYVYLPPANGNMYICLNKKTGEMTEWEFGQLPEEKSGYYTLGGKAYFSKRMNKDTYNLFSIRDSKLYEVNVKTGDSKEINVSFDMNELRKHEPGFCEYSQWLQYVCLENSFNTLTDFLDDNITGGAFDRDRQIRAYGEIAVNHDGTCGEKVYEFVHSKLSE